MSYMKYLKEHAGWIAIWLFLIVAVDTFLLTINGASMLMLFVAVMVTVCIGIGTYIDYRRSKRFLDELQELADTLEKTYLLPEMISEPRTGEQEQLVAVLKQMERSMGDEIGEYRRTGEEYKSYIETWVHEVKIPIATALMIVENHKNEIVKDVGIENEIKRIQNYVEQALFFARSEAVEKDYMIKEIDPEEIVGTVIFDKKRMLREKRAGVDMHDMTPSKKIVSDGKWLAFIISQVIDNSIKYAKTEENLMLEIFLSEDMEGSCLHIKDNGIGMKSGEVSRAFEKGFTGTNGRGVAASTGMGLYLCKKLCKRLEHDLVLKSVEGEGTEVIIRFR